MNHDRPYHKRRHRDDYDQHVGRPPPIETPEEKLRAAIIKLGEVDPTEELPRLTKQIRQQISANVTVVSEGFRIGVTEQPYKIPFYAALLRLLHDPEDNSASAGTPLGKQILEDFWKGFQAFLDKLAWREARLCIHFFSHLTMAKVISAESMSSLLQSFTAVLDEFGVSHGRAKRAALCAAEGLVIGGSILNQNSPKHVTDIIDSIQNYCDITASSKWLVQPVVNLSSDATFSENSDELLDTVLACLRSLDSSSFADTITIFPQPYAKYPDLDTVPFELPSVLVPPEVIEMDGLSDESGEDLQVKKEEWPEYFFRLFDNDVTPDPNTPVGYVIRSTLRDIVDIFEVNRKECARLLLEYPKWTVSGTFKPKPGAPVEPNPPEHDRSWQLESTIIETILGCLFTLPESSQKSVYYISLITELCKLSPSTGGPAVGKSIRKLYNFLADGLDVEIARRFAEWFAVHMSNFGFQWVWKEWTPDLALTPQHPKRAFMRRAVELEIRLSYHDRILKTLPEAMQAEDAFIIQAQAPGPDFEYDDIANPHHDAAQLVLNLLRGRADANDVISHLESLRNSLEVSDEDTTVDALVRSIAVQSLLHIGSRSFSHLLNAIERYLPLLRILASGGAASTASGSGDEAKRDILTAVSMFWKRSRNMVSIVFDKLMQYQIVDPNDVVGWTFENGSASGRDEASRLNAFQWDLVKAALDKANGRVMIAKKKVKVLRKEEDDTRAKVRAGGADNSMEVDVDAKEDDIPVQDSPALTTALKAFASLTREQKAALSRTLEGFIHCLAHPGVNRYPQSREVLTEKAWHNRANWGKEHWDAWMIWGWYRQFCKAYAPYLRNYSVTLTTVSFSKLEGAKDPDADLVKKIFYAAIGQEV